MDMKYSRAIYNRKKGKEKDRGRFFNRPTKLHS